jgi:hypothetical protein
LEQLGEAMMPVSQDASNCFTQVCQIRRTPGLKLTIRFLTRARRFIWTVFRLIGIYNPKWLRHLACPNAEVHALRKLAKK